MFPSVSLGYMTWRGIVGLSAEWMFNFQFDKTTSNNVQEILLALILSSTWPFHESSLYLVLLSPHSPKSLFFPWLTIIYTSKYVMKTVREIEFNSYKSQKEIKQKSPSESLFSLDYEINFNQSKGTLCNLWHKILANHWIRTDILWTELLFFFKHYLL